MKKILLLSLLMSVGGMLFAQSIHYYDFSVETRSYDSLASVNQTLLGEKSFSAISGMASASNWVLCGDTAFSVRNCGQIDLPANPIGFEFDYEGRVFQYFHVLANGALVLKEAPEASVMGTGSFLQDTCSDLDNAVYSYVSNASVYAGTEVGYGLQGEPGKQVLVLQYKGLLANSGVDTLDFQIRLYEEDGRIEIVYGEFVSNSQWGGNVNVGLRSDAVDGGICNVGVFSAAGPWQEAVAYDTLTGRSTNANQFSMKLKSGNYPEKGLTYVFSKPAACQVPEMPLRVEAERLLSDGISGLFETEAQSCVFVAVQGDAEIEKSLLTDGRDYRVGDIVDAETGAFFMGRFPTEVDSTVGHFSLAGLMPSTDYMLYAYSCNYACTGGHVYSEEPFAFELHTLYAAPALAEAQLDTNSIHLKYVLEDGTHLVLALSGARDTSVAGSLQGSLSVGDTLPSGAVVYGVGESNEIQVGGLQSNVSYVIEAWAMAVDGDDTVYSTLSSRSAVRTAGVLPCTWSFENEAPKTLPIGFANRGQAGFEVAKEGGDFWGNGAQFLIEAELSGGGMDTAWLDMPSLYLHSGKHRFNISLGLEIQAGFSTTAYQLVERDTLRIEYSSDGIDWETACMLHAGNQTLVSKDFVEYELPFFNMASGVAAFRLLFTSDNAVKIKIKSMTSEYVGNCDYPVDLSVVEGSATEAGFDVVWYLREDATAQSYQVAYRLLDGDWAEPMDVDTTYAHLRDLESGACYSFRVRSVCAGGNHSQWAESADLGYTKYAIPFQMDFDKEEDAVPVYFGAVSGTKFPESGDTVSLTVTESPFSWKLASSPYSDDEENKSLKMDIMMPAWYFLPEVAMKRAASMDFVFSVLGTYDGAPCEDTIEGSFYVAVSVDSGKTVQADHLLCGWGTGTDQPIMNLDSVPVHLDLSALEGYASVRLGFYVTGNSMGQNATLWIDDIAVRYNCPDPENIRIAASEDSAWISWQESDSAISWAYRYGKVGDTVYVEGEVSEPRLVLSGLQASTDYEFGLVSLCAKDQESSWVTESFRTADPYVCPAVTNLRSSIGKQAITLSWDGSAYAYNVRYRLLGENDWNHIETAEIVLEISGLEADGAEYEYSVQSICSETPGDTSAWSEIQIGQTAYTTCFPPESFRIEVEQLEAEILFVSEASEVEMEWMKLGSADTARLLVENGSRLTGLEPATDYQARLRAICSVGDTSEWTEMLGFSTLPVSNSGYGEAGIAVYGEKGGIRISNPAALALGSIEIYDLSGRLLLTVTAFKDTEKFIWLAQGRKVVLVKVGLDDGNFLIERVYVY